jgi:hypothetical protein
VQRAAGPDSTHHACRHTRARSVITAVVFCGSVVASIQEPLVLLAVTGALLLVYLGVILPAVWFRQPARRRDARAVLQQLLEYLRPPSIP